MIQLSETVQAALEARNPQRVLLEFPDPEGGDPTIFTNEDIAVSRGLHWSAAFNGDEELTFGLCPSATISCTLLNDHRQLEGFTFGECSAWIGVRIGDTGTASEDPKRELFDGDGLYEFVPLGWFIVERPDIVMKDQIEITASDRMTLFDEEMPSKTDLNLNPTTANPVTILQLVQALCTHVGVELANTGPDWFMNHDLSFTSWPSKYFESRTMREVLKWCAEAAGSIARFTRQGKLEFAWFTEVPASAVSYDEHDYSEMTQTWYETAAIDGLKVRNQGETSESTYGTDPENAYVIAGNPFLR